MFRLELSREEAPQDHFLDMSIGGRSPADLTESALRSAFFGEPNPLADQHMGFAAEIPDPFGPLRQHPVSEEIIRPLSELLVTDVLVSTGRARRIRAFRLGVAIRGHRRLSLEWEAPNRYANEPLMVRHISGEVTI
jgi:hypothetical protein